MLQSPGHLATERPLQIIAVLNKISFIMYNVSKKKQIKTFLIKHFDFVYYGAYHSQIKFIEVLNIYIFT